MHEAKFDPLSVFILRLGMQKVSWLNGSTLTFCGGELSIEVVISGQKD